MLALADIRLLIDDMNDSANVLDGYLTPDQLAKQLGVTTRTLLRWDVQRIGPTRTVFGRQVLYKVASVRLWLEAREQRRKRAN